MITQALLSFFFGIGNTVLNFLPAVDFLPDAGAIASIAGVWAGISSFMPMAAMGSAVKLFVAVQMLKFTSSLINWILRKVPTIG